MTLVGGWGWETLYLTGLLEALAISRAVPGRVPAAWQVLSLALIGAGREGTF